MPDIVLWFRSIIMKIVVYGLGIIGASVAASLKKAGHTVLGKNRSRESIDYAVEHAMIDGEADGYEGADVIVLALPPYLTAQLLAAGSFPDGCIVTDICGVKRMMEDAVYCVPRKWRYVGTHPMAGKETSGIRSASDTLFMGANFVITRCGKTDSAALDAVRTLARDMGFSRIVECSAAEHDRMIALTSQLCHVAANAYVATPLSAGCAGFTGGSFQDMTRVAPVDGKMWAELFCCNADFLAEETARLVARLCEFEQAVRLRDAERLIALMKEGKTCYEDFFRKN